MKRRGLGIAAMLLCFPQVASASELRIYLIPGSLEAKATLRINGRSAEFIVDTGASQSQINEATFNSLGLDQGEPQYARSRLADGRIVTSRIARFQNIEFGDFQVPYLNTTVTANGDNLLGMDVLGRFRVILDPPNNTLTIQNPNDEELRLNGNEAKFPFNPRRFSIQLQIILNGTPVTMTLDTGATQTTLSQRIANALELPVIGTSASVVADGKSIGSKVVRISTATLGNYTINNLNASVIDNAIGERGGDGLLGYNFLRNFRLILDPTTRQGYLQQ